MLVAPLLLALLQNAADPVTAPGPPVAGPDCSRGAGALPDPTAPPGTPRSDIPLEHIVVLMEENHSFDNLLGRLNVGGYGDAVDGVTPEMTNPDGSGAVFHAFHQPKEEVANPEHSWDSVHAQFNNGAMDGFVVTNGGGRTGERSLGYYEAADLPYLYAIANRFAVGDRYFSSLLGPTEPNRGYLYAATSLGHVRNGFKLPQSTTLIFDVMNRFGVSWKYYVTDLSIAKNLLTLKPEARSHFRNIAEYHHDLRADTLPAVVFLETSLIEGEEHPPFDIHDGQRRMERLIGALTGSKAWASSALILVYDEHGGFFDHVPPPQACAPDDIAPILTHDHAKAGFDRYGIRVPLVVVSPYARRHFVSHRVYDHTSILKLIETRFNLPALTRRDANADAMLDLFDFTSPPQLDHPLPLP